MDPMQAAAAALCVLVGLSLGLLGGGGSVLMVPVFVYVAGMPVQDAIALSLVVVGLSSAAGAVSYWRRGCVNKRLILLFVIPGSIASFLGARAAGWFTSRQLLFMFGGIMLLIAGVLYARASRGREQEGPLVCRPGLAPSMLIGALVGFLTGLLGVGGGFLIVPAIALLMKCSFHTAIGTSLAVIVLNSASGFIGHLSTVDLDVFVGALFLAATAVGAVAGAGLAKRISVASLQKAFALLIFLVGSFVVASNLVKHAGDSL